jgi:hypothetical protein
MYFFLSLSLSFYFYLSLCIHYHFTLVSIYTEMLTVIFRFPEAQVSAERTVPFIYGAQEAADGGRG